MSRVRAWLTSDHRRLPLQMVGVALLSRLIMIISAWYFSWAVTPVWPDFLKGSRAIAPWFQWDGYHYARIAFGGYTDTGVAAFFPLYPLIVRYAGQLTGQTSMEELQRMGVFVGWVLFLVATWWMTKLFTEYFDEAVARTAMMLFLFSPFSFFFSTAYSEALLMLEIAICLLAIRKERFWIAAGAAAFSTATRVTGLALVFAVMVGAWKYRKSIPQILALGVVGMSGLAAYMLHTWIARDDAIAFLHAQEGWGGWDIRAGNYIRGVLAGPVQFVFGDVGHPVMLFNMIMYGLSAILLVVGIKKIPLEAWCLSFAVLVQSSLSVQSMGRYLLPMVTTYLVAAIVLHRLPESVFWRQAVVSSSIVAMMTLFLLFGHGAWIV